MKTGDCITHEEMMAILRVKMRFAAYRDEPTKRGRLYRAKREALDLAIREMIETCATEKERRREGSEGETMTDGKPTCGDCKHCHRWPGNIGLCTAPSPICVFDVAENTTLRHVFYSADAKDCDCFERKDAK